jgi:transcriptional regulator with XRE-family HTH domain
VTLGERVKATRKARGWTREQLAVRANLSGSTIGRIERGGHTPHASVIIALAGALDLPVEQLAADAGVTIHLPDPEDKWS